MGETPKERPQEKIDAEKSRKRLITHKKKADELYTECGIKIFSLIEKAGAFHYTKNVKDPDWPPPDAINSAIRIVDRQFASIKDFKPLPMGLSGTSTPEEVDVEDSRPETRSLSTGQKRALDEDNGMDERRVQRKIILPPVLQKSPVVNKHSQFQSLDWTIEEP